MGTIVVIAMWGLLAAMISLLATRLLLAWHARKSLAATVRIVFVAVLATIVVADLLVFQGDLFRREKWWTEGKGAYLWYLFPLATLFFSGVAGVASFVVLSLSRERRSPGP